MAEYKHGAYAKIQTVGARVADSSPSAIVYIGTAPVHKAALGAGETYPVNRPVLINNIAEARKYFGYSDDWTKYTLCEAMHVHFELNGIGPLVFINVLDPATHKEASTKSVTATSATVYVEDAEDINLASLTVEQVVSGGTNVPLTLGTDYSAAYDEKNKRIVLKELIAGKLNGKSLALAYDTVKPGNVTAANIIGSTDGYGNNTGLYAVNSVYQLTGKLPAYIAAPGWAENPEVHEVMYAVSQKINGHWDAYMFVDLPVAENSAAIVPSAIAAWKASHGYTKENETVFYPMALGTDDKYYHLSVLAAANFQKLLAEYDGIPWHTASNTDCAIIKRLYIPGTDDHNFLLDVEVINDKMNKNGIASAAFVGGRWAIWGCHSADYNQESADSLNVSETNRMMLFYLSNDFQLRRSLNVDRPMTANDLYSIVSEEQTRLDALLNIGALTHGDFSLNAVTSDLSDILTGDFSFTFNITTWPLARSLTAVVNWTEDGFVTYYENFIA